MIIGTRHIGFAITNNAGDEVYELALQSGEMTDGPALESWYRQYPVLHGPFQKISVCYDFPQSLLIPQAEWKEETDTKQLVQAVYGAGGKEVAVTEQVGSWQISNAYTIRKEIYDSLQQFFPAHHYWHGYTLAIRDIDTTGFEGLLNVVIRSEEFLLIVSKGNKFLLAQTFEYASPADVIYYLLQVCQQFKLSQEAVRVQLSGLIDQGSALYRELEQYFLHTQFRQPSWIASAGSDEYPAHFFTPINDLARCAL
ncbi:MAG TPA: DUF3822 family protein [Chitinophagaceae bacterium]|nr:DUF3822 family protein [Chitinophagaceae bacterium]